MGDFNVTVVDYEAKHLTGIKVRTSMSKAQQDCPAIWGKLCPKIAGIEATPSYGVAIMLNEVDFDYWAAVEAPEGQLPEDLEHVDIPAGKYAVCSVPNLASIGEAYTFIFEKWLGSQQTYAYNPQAPCFELYPAHWNPEAAFSIYVAVKG